MDGELVSGSTSAMKEGRGSEGVSSPFHTYEEIFNKYFPYYLTLGMNYEDYWERDCLLVEYYREAAKLERDKHNQEMWLQGLYVYDAMIRISPILQAFAKAGTKPQPYVEKPYDLSKEAVENTKQEKAKEQFNKGKRFMEQFSVINNQSFKNNEDKGVSENA